MSDFEQFITKIKDQINISEYIGKYVDLKSVGLSKYKGLCPFHNEKTPSFYVNDDSKNYHCFGCGVHGDIITFMQEKEGYDFKSAIEILAGKIGLTLPNLQKNSAIISKNKTLYEINKTVLDFYKEHLEKSNFARKYLHNRGLVKSSLTKFLICYAPKGNFLEQYLLSKGFDKSDIILSGLVRQSAKGNNYDLFQDRIMFPIFDVQNRVIGFGGRVLDDSLPKYVNSSESAIFQKKEILYNINNARKIAYESKEIFVCEGYMDVIKLSKYGIDNAVAPLGTAFSKHHLEQIWKIVESPTICMDGDAAGLKSMYRLAIEALTIIKPGKSLNIALLPDGKDPDDVISSTNGVSIFRNIISKSIDLPEFIFNYNRDQIKTHTPSLIAGFESMIYNLCKKISDEFIKKQYINYFKQRFFEYNRLIFRNGNIDQSAKIPNINIHNHSESYKFEKQITKYILNNPSILKNDKAFDEICDLRFIDNDFAEILGILIENQEKIIDINESDYIELLDEFANKMQNKQKFSEIFKLEILKLDDLDNTIYDGFFVLLNLYYLANMRHEYNSLIISDSNEDVLKAESLKQQIFELEQAIN